VGWPFSDDELRAMYQGGRANKTARQFAHLWATVFAWGLFPKRWVTLEVPGRRTGELTRFPLGMAQADGQWYLVSMLGEGCNWVKNVRAAGGKVILRRRRAVAYTLIEVPPEERAPIIKRYLSQVPGARPHVPIDRRSALVDFEAIAHRYPIFRAIPATAGRHGESRGTFRSASPGERD
jgi:deazaflavin-dependent oxidoreductase (nitroreductase family)